MTVNPYAPPAQHPGPGHPPPPPGGTGMSEGAKVALIIAGTLGGLVVVGFIAMQILGFALFGLFGAGASKGEGPFGLSDGASGFYTGNMYRGHVDLVDGSVSGATLATAIKSSARAELASLRQMTCPDVEHAEEGTLVTCSTPATTTGGPGRWLGIVEFRTASGDFNLYASSAGLP